MRGRPLPGMPVTMCVCGGATPGRAALASKIHCVSALPVNARPCRPRPIPLTSTPCTLHYYCCYYNYYKHSTTDYYYYYYKYPATCGLLTKICCSTPSPLLQPLSAWSQGQIPLIHEASRAQFHPSPPDCSTPSYTAAAVGRGSLGVGADMVEGAGAGGAGGNLPTVMTGEEYQRLMSSGMQPGGVTAPPLPTVMTEEEYQRLMSSWPLQVCLCQCVCVNVLLRVPTS